MRAGRPEEDRARGGPSADGDVDGRLAASRRADADLAVEPLPEGVACVGRESEPLADDQRQQHVRRPCDRARYTGQHQ
jgi:hypothetical protein